MWVAAVVHDKEKENAKDMLTCNFEDDTIDWVQVKDSQRLLPDPVFEGRPAVERCIGSKVIDGVDTETLVPVIKFLRNPRRRQ